MVKHLKPEQFYADIDNSMTVQDCKTWLVVKNEGGSWSYVTALCGLMCEGIHWHEDAGKAREEVIKRLSYIRDAITKNIEELKDNDFEPGATVELVVQTWIRVAIMGEPVIPMPKYEPKQYS